MDVRVEACLGRVDHAVRYVIVDCVSVSDDAVLEEDVLDVVPVGAVTVGAVGAVMEDG